MSKRIFFTAAFFFGVVFVLSMPIIVNATHCVSGDWVSDTTCGGTADFIGVCHMSAACTDDGSGDSFDCVCPASSTTVPSFSAQAMIDILKNIGDWVFVLGMLIAVIMVIIGATYFLTGGGDPTRIATGKKIFLWGGVGLALILLARGVFTVLRSILGA